MIGDMTLEEIVKILGKMNDRMYVVRRHLEEASSVAKVYKKYIIELWTVDTKDPKNNLCSMSVQEIGQWTDRNKDELIKTVEIKFMEQLLNNVKENRL